MPTFDEKIQRLERNEARFDDFVNELGTYLTENNVSVETLRSFINRKNDEINTTIPVFPQISLGGTQDGNRLIRSFADLVLAPNGNVQFSGKRATNVAPGADLTDAATMQNLSDFAKSFSSAAFSIGDFTPTVAGTTSPGTASYTRQYGTYFKISNAYFVMVDIVWSNHTGTGDFSVPLVPNPIPSVNTLGNSTAGAFRRGVFLGTALVSASFTDVPGRLDVYMPYFPNGSLQLLAVSEGTNPAGVSLPTSGSVSIAAIIQTGV